MTFVLVCRDLHLSVHMLKYHYFSLPILRIGKSTFDTLNAQVQMNVLPRGYIHADDGSNIIVMSTDQWRIQECEKGGAGVSQPSPAGDLGAL